MDIWSRYSETKSKGSIRLDYQFKEAPWSTYSYFRIESDVKFDIELIGFIVHKCFAENNKIRLVVYDSEWIILNTQLVQVGEYYYYRAYANKFGIFAVVAISKALKQLF